jgi:hypothetical protein
MKVLQLLQLFFSLVILAYSVWGLFENCPWRKVNRRSISQILLSCFFTVWFLVLAYGAVQFATYRPDSNHIHTPDDHQPDYDVATPEEE